MAEQRDYIGLDWVEGEIKSTLAETRNSLEKFAESNGDSSYLTQCQTELQQIVSTMKMLEQHGARLLTEEMLELVFSMHKLPAAETREHLIVLMQCLLLLPDYLGEVYRTGRDEPQKLKPILRQIRKLRDHSQLNDVEFFAPEINLPEDELMLEQLEVLRDKGFTQLVRKLRQKYQLCLASIIRDVHRQKQLEIISKIFARMQNYSWGAPIAPLWDAAAAVVEGLKEGSITLDADITTLLRELDHQLKMLALSDVEGLNEAPSELLLRHLLYRVALADSVQPLITSLSFRYNLNDALLAAQEEPEETLLNLEATQSAVANIREELSYVKDALDLYMVNPEMHQPQLREQLPVLEQLSHTLSMLGMDRQQQLLSEQAQQLNGIITGSNLANANSNRETLLDVASQLLRIESALSHFSGDTSQLTDDSEMIMLTDAQQTVLEQARQTLAEAQGIVVDYLDDTDNPNFLKQLPPLFQTIQGSLAMIDLGRASEQITSCRDHIEERWLIQQHSPKKEETEALVDFIININGYLEQLSKRHHADAEKYLNMSEPSLQFILSHVSSRTEAESVKPTTQNSQTQEIELTFEYPSDSLIDIPADFTSSEGRSEASLETLELSPIPQSEPEKPVAYESPELFIDFISEQTPATTLADTDVAFTAPEPLQNTTEVEADGSDTEIKECFIEEATEVYKAVLNDFNVWRQSPDEHLNQLQNIRRGFHTLKGSGRIVHADVIAELAWAIENMLNHLLDDRISVCDQMLDLINNVLKSMPSLIRDFAAAHQAFIPEVAIYLETADALSKGNLFFTDEEDGPPEPESTAQPSALLETVAEESVFDAHLRDEQIPEIAEAFIELQSSVSLNEPAQERAVKDQQLLSIFATESRGHLDIVLDFIKLTQRPSYQNGEHPQITEQVQRALHTLKGSAFMAGIEPLAELAAAAEATVKEYRSHRVPADDQIFSLLEQGVALIENGLGQLHQPPHQINLSLDGFLNRQKAIHHELMQRLQSKNGETDTKVEAQDANLFLANDLSLLFDAQQHLEGWSTDIPVAELDRFKFELNTLGENAKEAELPAMAQLCDILLDICVYLDEQETVLPDILLKPLTNGFEALVDMMNQVAAHQAPAIDESVFQGLRKALLALHQQKADSEAFDSTGLVEEEIVLPPPKPASKPSPSILTERHPNTELLQLFLEEGFERVENAAGTFELWLQNISNLQYIDELQRDLHSLKGGANMTEQHDLAELCHGLEGIYQFIADGRCQPESAPFALIQQGQDMIEVILNAISKNQPLPSATLLIKQLKIWSPDQPGLASTASREPAVETLPDYLGQPTATVVSSANTRINSDAEKAPQHGITEIASVEAFPVYAPPVKTEDYRLAKSLPQASEMVRIPADLLESLINLAGEASIGRSRIEQQISDSEQLLNEMNATTARIKDQLRRLDIETQTQIISRHQNDEQDELDFDPLEMDQYSELTQLSHSLVETATDLMDIHEVLQQNARESERLLLQQSRTQTELQEQLMKARLESFSRLVPRLRKTVRQASEELGKYVNLEVTNPEGEMDRNTLKRIQAPLEHMLRNAISHGIEESPEARLAAGKPETGTISISLRRDGSDLLIELSDDGRGIDIDTIKAQALKQNLITTDNELTDQDALQLILRSGFTTAKKVTNISGRGIGMDVVNSEVRRLGGSIMIGSEKGIGSRFILRLPLTQSIGRALMVEVGNNLYAMPLPSIDGVSMVEPQQLIDCYKSGMPLNYGDAEYKLLYMGDLLDRNKPKALGERCPVILVERGDERLALHVDTLLGTREIITKSLGIQFAGLIGVNGATMLGDGRVVVIIDPASLYRRFSRHHHIVQTREITTQAKAPKVLVVDDSVTVRKVTSRLLSRQGYDVETARDGMEAMARLLENQPDVVLLDIEMPKMDGFEVASAIRNNNALKDLPIIMITSRTGEKHRNRAFNLGANDYLGKPFQEGPLLEAISKLVVTA